MKPTATPRVPLFSSGPCAKRPGWDPAALSDAAFGRSHRSMIGKSKLRAVIDRSRILLGVPDDYRIGIVPASDTGAFEMAMWSMLGARGVDLLAWESFGSGWVTDVVKQLKLEDVRVFEADYGQIADLSATDSRRDIVFTFNGTTSGVRVPDGHWIADNREGLTLCDATSAVFAMDVPWNKLDVTTYSWQKVLGGEGAHGMLILSPRAVERLESYAPTWPMPKIFRLTKGGKLIEGIFKGETINTPSMLAVEDVLDALKWVEQVGGLAGMIARSKANLAAVSAWVEKSDWASFLAADPAVRSSTSICISASDPWFDGLSEDERRAAMKQIDTLLEAEGVAFDINGHRDAPAGLRIWGGATVEAADIEALLPWLDWAYAQVKQSKSRAV